MAFLLSSCPSSFLPLPFHLLQVGFQAPEHVLKTCLLINISRKRRKRGKGGEIMRREEEKPNRAGVLIDAFPQQSLNYAAIAVVMQGRGH